MYNEFAENITKESDSVRQKHYTTKKHWLVDFINIFWFIFETFLSAPVVIGDTPRPDFVLRIIPSAKIKSPATGL